LNSGEHCSNGVFREPFQIVEHDAGGSIFVLVPNEVEIRSAVEFKYSWCIVGVHSYQTTSGPVVRHEEDLIPFRNSASNLQIGEVRH